MVKKLMAKVLGAVRKNRPITGTFVVEQPVAAESSERPDIEEALSALEGVDHYGRQLAGDDPALRRLLGGFELTLARQLGQQVRRTRHDQGGGVGVRGQGHSHQRGGTSCYQDTADRRRRVSG